MATQYFHALLLHGPQQHEIVCSRSVNTENEERLFKSAANAAKCTDRKPQNMLPTVLKRLKVKRASKMGPIHSIRDQNSRIGSRAADLPNYAGSGRLTYMEKEHVGLHLSQVMSTFMMVSLTVTVILLGHMYSMLAHPCWKMLL